MRWQLQGVSYIVLKRHELWSTNGLKLDRKFYPPSVDSAFYFIAKLRRRGSSNGTQPYKSRDCFSPKIGDQKLLHLLGLSMTLRLNIFEIKRAVDNRAKALGSTRHLLHCSKISWTLAYNGLKQDRSFRAPSVNSAFCFVARRCTRNERTNERTNEVYLPKNKKVDNGRLPVEAEAHQSWPPTKKFKK